MAKRKSGMPQMAALDDLIRARQTTLTHVANEGGTSPSSLSRAIAGLQNSSLADTEAWFNVLGHTLVPVPISGAKPLRKKKTPIEEIRDKAARSRPEYLSDEDRAMVAIRLAGIAGEGAGLNEMRDRIYGILTSPPHSWSPNKVARALGVSRSGVMSFLKNKPQ